MLFSTNFKAKSKLNHSRYLKNSKTGNSIAPWTLFLFYMARFYMQYKGWEKAAKVVEFKSVYGT